MLLEMTGWELEGPGLNSHKAMFETHNDFLNNLTLVEGYKFGNAINCGSVVNDMTLKRNFDANDGVFSGFHFKLGDTYNGGTFDYNSQIFRISDTSADNREIIVRFDSNGRIHVRSAELNNSSFIDHGSRVLYTDGLLNKWNFIEFSYESIAGAYTLTVKGKDAEFVVSTNIANISNFKLNYYSSVEAIDNLYVCDKNGSINNDFLGEVVIEGLHPNEGTSNWISSNSNENYQNVSDDDDSTFISTLRNQEIELFLFPNLRNAGENAYGVKVEGSLKSSSNGSPIIEFVSQRGNDLKVLDSINIEGLLTKENKSSIIETSPQNTLWTRDNISNSAFGIRTNY